MGSRSTVYTETGGRRDEVLAFVGMVDGGRSTADPHPAGFLCAIMQALSSAIAASSDWHCTDQQSDTGMSRRLKQNANIAGPLVAWASKVEIGANAVGG